MIKEHDQQAKMKATPRKLAYVDSNKEAPVGSLARGFSDRFSLESSGTSDTRKQTRSASKSWRTPSKNKESTHLRRSRRLEDRSITKEKVRRERSKPKGKGFGHQETSSDSEREEGLEDACIFSTAAEQKEWPMPVWCKMFRQTLGRAARNWFDDLDPKSVDNFEELSQKLLEEFSQQKRYAKDLTEIHGIKRRQNEGLQAFMDRFKSESSHIKGVHIVLCISAFMHGHGHPELAKKLNDKIPKTMNKMFERARAFIRGEVADGSAEMVKTQKMQSSDGRFFRRNTSSPWSKRSSSNYGESRKNISNEDLKKEEIKIAPLWVKLHHVPIVAYSEVGLSLIATQLGRPIMMDSYIKGIVDSYIASKMKEALDVATAYAVAASLSEFELKKILIDKMEANKSVNRSDNQKNIYNALVESYNSDKDIMSSYGDVVILKRGQDDQDKDEDPSAGSDQGTKRRKSGKDTKSSKDIRSKKKESPVQLKYDQHAYFGTSHWGPKRQNFYGYESNLTSSKDVYSIRRIIAVTRLTILKMYDYGHLEEIEVYRDDQQLYTFKEVMEYVNDVRTALHDIAARIRMEYLPMRKWSNLDKKRDRVMVKYIEKQLYQRRLMRNLKMFVGGRIYEKDLRLLERTI
ncbi:reverse transcriptase domain-containing protein [Tanacetum coccineum]|uniref:Reverse transcriptase domain-containing protein n=1 Tax=Tanacetum coccineum TaxID=301880 RepID=A0ABQ4Y021_9ASTR